VASTIELRNALRERFIPVAMSAGFVRQPHSRLFWEFQRTSSGSRDVFNIQWEKHGLTRFTVNFFQRRAVESQLAEAKGEFSIRNIPNGRLQPQRGGALSCWFRQDRTLLERIATGQRLRPAADVAKQLVALFPELLEYWETGVIGPHMTLSPRIKMREGKDK
jgi:hypothetical protein